MHVFPEKGAVNSAATMERAVTRAKELSIRHVVVASNSGDTARLFLDKGLEVVCVTHHVGFRNPGEDEMPLAVRQELQDKGVKILTTTHLFAGIERGYNAKFSGFGPAYITASTLRMFGQGTKVAIEVAVMALDAGLVPYGEDIIAIGGSGRGADAAVVLRPAHANRFTETAIREIICKPYV